MDSIEDIRAQYVDPLAFEDDLDSWEGFWDDDLNLYENYCNIIHQSVILPWEDDLLPIVAGYFCASAKWSKILPVMLCWGLQGSGKSTLANLSVILRGVNRAFSPNDTFASIRNELDTLKYFDPEEKLLKRDNTIMAWDNVYASSFEVDMKLYRMMLVGYDAKQSIIRIANSNGGNYEFDVFCPKVLSSVEALHQNSSFGELHRRLLIIPHKQVTETSQTLDGSRDVGELISISDVDWNGISDKFFEFWMTKENCGDFTRWRNWLSKNVGKKTSSIQLPATVNSLRWTISLDIAATMLAANKSGTPEWAIDCITRYWQRIDRVTGFTSPFKEQLEYFIDLAVGEQVRANEIATKAGIAPPFKISINPTDLKTFMELCFSEGKLDEFPSVKRYTPLMAELGWKLSRKGWIKQF
jgi:hypothetical protein